MNPKTVQARYKQTAYTLTRSQHYQDAPWIILIHGLGLCQKIWEDIIPRLSRHYNVLSYDLYGHGESEPYHKVATLSTYAHQIVELMDACAISKAALVGFSVGGLINRRFALDYPERLSALVILNSPHTRDKQAQIGYEERAANVRKLGSTGSLDAALTRWFTPHFHQTDPATVQQVRQWVTNTDQESYAQTLWVLVTGVKELSADILDIALPTFIATCEHDMGSTPAMAYKIQAQIPSSQVYIIAKLQHLGVLEQPDMFAKLISQFLNKQLLAV